ncbi:MAG: 4Fe-4S cluster-binding domain-containing protein [Candidatus Sericytochromatia bacterium]
MLPLRSRARQIVVPCQDVSLRNLAELSVSELAAYHEQGLALYRASFAQAAKPTALARTQAQPSKQTGYSWLAIKRAWAQALLSDCNYCVHNCRVNRVAGETGYCGLTDQALISGEYLHHGEEAKVGTTHAIFFSGCTLHCLFCHNWRETFDLSAGAQVDAIHLAEQIRLRCADPTVQSISFIGGTPEPHLHTLTALAEILPEAIALPWVFNSNATLSATGLALMEGLIDLYLPDFKFGNDRCAWQLAKISHYSDTLEANLQAYQAQSRQTAAYGRPVQVLIRHLLMPGHLACCTLPVLEKIAAVYPEMTVNLMGQYRPFYKAREREELNRRLAKADLEMARARAHELGLTLT